MSEPKRTAESRDRGLRIESLHVSYGSQTVLSDITLDVPAGRTLAIVGPSGCGKSTLLKTICGLLTPDSGTITLAGRDITSLPSERRNIGLVPQNYALFPHLNVQRNVEYGLRVRHVPRDERSLRVQEAISFVQLEDLARRRTNELSGGQRQRVALARALVISPDALLLDEPLSALDPQLRVSMRRQLRSILQSVTDSVQVIVTHDQQEAMTMADLVAVMRDGHVVQVGSPQEIWAHPADAFVADFLCNAALLDVTVTDEAVHAFDGAWRIPNVAFDEVPAAGSAHMLVRRDSLEASPSLVSPGAPSQRAALHDHASASVIGLVLASEYTGERHLLTVDVSGTRLPVTMSPGDGRQIQVGAHVALSLRPGGAALFAEEAAR
ncbi:ABC transporter ATP-binding protein [Pseudoclavibacter sp. CFCC 13611]|uniref:ABC transporter ATP-binding protein n=1 Tax=Pseudoclavibacter sp. CFCC 13611 TaxID=2615178 RepID=UPI001301558C|nr:ABC transporter ATP-binding protein [Pseudoclavibacter sp. CFCC 13611]KAB1664210.1 ABC transporter ATP-binding protein [Pseudoclavibacter sp. CFCC 13611]